MTVRGVILEDLLGLDTYSGGTLVSIQSVSLAPLTLKYLKGAKHFEDRNLYLAEFLREEGNGILHVISDSPDDCFLNYHLRFLERSLNLAHGDLNNRVKFLRIPILVGEALTQRILESRFEFRRLEAALHSLPNPILDFWVTGPSEIELASRLGLPHVGLAGSLLGVDGKSSARRVFRETGIPHPTGREDIYSLSEVQEAVRMLARDSASESFLVKINDEEAGNGIAEVSRTVCDGSSVAFRSNMEISKSIPLSEFESRLSEVGCVVEERIVAECTANPSVQMQISESGKIKNLATHEQVLSGHSYSGSIFPADEAFRGILVSAGYEIAKHLRSKGVRGIFSVDFLATRQTAGAEWSLHALEINVRKGATTHPYFWTRILTGCQYDEDVGVLKGPSGEVVYVSTEYVHSPKLHHLTATEIIDLVRSEDIEFSVSRRSGILLHMVSSMQAHGKIGATAVANDHRGAFRLLDRLRNSVSNLAATAV